MAADGVNACSGLKLKNYVHSYNSDKINEFISSKSVNYDGKRIKWFGSYESLQVFVKTAFDQQGKWRAYGGNSKRFDASTSDFVVIWYPGKLNTLTFNGQCGDLAKEFLISLCRPTSSRVDRDLNDCASKCYDPDQSVDDLKLEVEILKCRMDSVQSLLDSKVDPKPAASNLSNDIALLQIDLEEQKSKNRMLEIELMRLQEEVKMLKLFCRMENPLVNAPLIDPSGLPCNDSCKRAGNITNSSLAIQHPINNANYINGVSHDLRNKEFIANLSTPIVVEGKSSQQRRLPGTMEMGSHDQLEMQSSEFPPSFIDQARQRENRVKPCDTTIIEIPGLAKFGKTSTNAITVRTTQRRDHKQKRRVNNSYKDINEVSHDQRNKKLTANVSTPTAVGTEQSQRRFSKAMETESPDPSETQLSEFPAFIDQSKQIKNHGQPDDTTVFEISSLADLGETSTNAIPVRITQRRDYKQKRLVNNTYKYNKNSGKNFNAYNIDHFLCPSNHIRFLNWKDDWHLWLNHVCEQTRNHRI